MAETTNLRITAVPDQALRLAHAFPSEPLPVDLRFGSEVLPVRLDSGSRSLAVDMRALLSARRALPLCLSLCDAICADSHYRVEISIFDRPVITIRLRGRTRFHSETS